MSDLGLRAAILTEAGPNQGLGHLARCIAIYDALETLGVTSWLFVAGEVARHLSERRRTQEREWRTTKGAVRALADADITVMDSYVATPAVCAAAAAVTTMPVYFDDVARLNYPRGIVVNGNPAAAELDFGSEPDRTLLLGADYQVMRREFWDAEPREPRTEIGRVLVTAGGTDAGGVRAALADAATSAYPHAEIDIVEAPRGATEMIAAIRAADIALSAAGQTLYELASAGTPAVAVCVSDNQLRQARALERAGAMVVAGTWGEADILPNVIRQLVALADPARRATMVAAGQRLVDGQGALRVARLCVRATVHARVVIKRATTEDESELLGLANDAEVRAMSFSTEQITPAEHRRWLRKVLDDPAILLLVARERARVMGQVRFNIIADEAVVSISLEGKYRGLGLAVPVLELAVAELHRQHPEAQRLLGYVKVGNPRSRALFETAGFALVPDEQTGIGSLRYARSLDPPDS